MKRKSLVYALTACCILGAGTAGAAAKDKLVLKLNDASTVDALMKDIRSIKFSGDAMTIDLANKAPQTVNLADVQNMTFDYYITGVEDVEAALGDVAIAIHGGVLTATAADGKAITLAVYNLGGMAVAAAAGTGTASVDLNALPAGAYIVRANNTVIKFTR